MLLESTRRGSSESVYQNGIKNKTVKLFESEDKFMDRLKQLSAKEDVQDEETVRSILKLMMEISI